MILNNIFQYYIELSNIVQYCQILSSIFNIVQKAKSALSCMSCHIVRNIQILNNTNGNVRYYLKYPNIVQYRQILDNIAKCCQKLSSSVQYCSSDYCLTRDIVRNIQIMSNIVRY